MDHNEFIKNFLLVAASVVGLLVIGWLCLTPRVAHNQWKAPVLHEVSR